MTDELDFEQDIRTRAREALVKLSGLAEAGDVEAAKPLVEELRNLREYELMGRLAEALSRRDPNDAKLRRLYAQCLIDTGKVTVAIDVLTPLARDLPKQHREHAEVFGLLGRSYKQIFFDAADKGADFAQEALANAVASYRCPFEEDPRNTWHGVNLVALLTRMRRSGIRGAGDLQPRDIARSAVASLESLPENMRDDWFLNTLAEVSLGLDDWESAERYLRQCVTASTTKDFHVNSLLRQLTEVWELDNEKWWGKRGKVVVEILRARLLELSGGQVEVSAEELRRLREATSPEDRQLEALLGPNGPRTYKWLKVGFDRAASVGQVQDRSGAPVGSGFLVRAGDFGLTPSEEVLLLTNFHVVNAHGASDGLKPRNAQVVFEAQADHRAYHVESIVWTSPIERHDASFLRLEGGVSNIAPLPLESDLPEPPSPSLPEYQARPLVYIIGHPGGRSLSFSIQNNELIDHEGPRNGTPQIPGVWRVHYRAPTERGSSGSPVFDARDWKVIALHHAGKRDGMPRLNGIEGSYSANEGIAIQSIIEAIMEPPQA